MIALLLIPIVSVYESPSSCPMSNCSEYPTCSPRKCCGNPNNGPVLGGIDLVDLYNCNIQLQQLQHQHQKEHTCVPKQGSKTLTAKPIELGGEYSFHFLNSSNMETFQSNPKKYAPGTGGFCAFSLTGFDDNGAGFWCACPSYNDGYAFVNGRLYFFLFSGARDAFLKHGNDSIAGVNKNWPELLQENNVDDFHCFNTDRLVPFGNSSDTSSDDPCNMMSCMTFIDCHDCHENVLPSYAVQHNAPAGWGNLTSQIIESDSEEFHKFIAPISESIYLSYTSTNGSYFNASDVAKSVGDGWTREHDLESHVQYGMRALFFSHAATQRVLVAFRGTDLNSSSVSGQADQCADSILWDATPRDKLPEYCNKFSNSTLDYLSNALQAVAKAHAVARLASYQFLYTGHSLGAGLASLVAIIRRYKLQDNSAVSVAVSSPPLVQVLQDREHIPASSISSELNFILGNKYDPVFHFSQIDDGGIGNSSTCTWIPDGKEPLACFICFNEPHPKQSSLSCLDCFHEEHIFAKYYYTLIPGPRPSCV
eukprot:m.82460 g.82460  ORF g.82460 m.82460 type:complete len:536 (+) comp12872_c0_seq1:2287-3894(+)